MFFFSSLNEESAFFSKQKVIQFFFLSCLTQKKRAASPSISISLTYKTSHLALRALGHNERAVFIVKREREREQFARFK